MVVSRASCHADGVVVSGWWNIHGVNSDREVDREIVRKIDNNLYWDVWAKTRGFCWYCGSELFLGKFTFDHVRPLSKRGKSVLENLVPCCRKCNLKKGDRKLEEFRNMFFAGEVNEKLTILNQRYESKSKTHQQIATEIENLRKQLSAMKNEKPLSSVSCPHENVYVHLIPVWWIFKKKINVCGLCRALLSVDKKQQF